MHLLQHIFSAQFSIFLPTHPYKNRSLAPITPPQFAPLYRTLSPLIAVLKALPWQMKSTRIIVFSPLKLPWNAVFCKVLSAFQGIVVFFSFTTFFAKKCKTKQITSVCSSQIVVSLGSADYCSNKFPNLINLLISLKCSAKIFLHFNHLTALPEHPYPIL